MASNRRECFRSESFPRESQVIFSKWIKRLITWDGILPMVTLLVPTLLGVLIPSSSDLMTILAVFIAIVSFFVRLGFGLKHLGENRVPCVVQGIQFIFFCVGLLLLTAMDALFMAIQGVSSNQMLLLGEDVAMIGIIYIIYFLCMVIAMFPGTTASNWRDLAESASQQSDTEIHLDRPE